MGLNTNAIRALCDAYDAKSMSGEVEAGTGPIVKALNTELIHYTSSLQFPLTVGEIRDVARIAIDPEGAQNDHGLNKIRVIKDVRNRTGMGLKAAKDEVEDWLLIMTQIVADAVNHYRAERRRRFLSRLGIPVACKECGWEMGHANNCPHGANDPDNAEVWD